MSHFTTQTELNDRADVAREPVGRDDNWLQTPSPDIIEQSLWPVPIFERQRQNQKAELGDTTIRPGDVLEVLTIHHIESLLVVSVLPKPVSRNPRRTADAGETLLVYSDEFQCFRQLALGPLIPHPDDSQLLTVGRDDNALYYLHRDIADTIARCGVDDHADHTYRQLPHDQRPVVADRTRYPSSHNRASQLTDSSEVKRRLDTATNSIIHGDARTVLHELPKNSIHAAITSPPYYEVRDYQHPDQIGQEPSVTQYLDELIEVIDATMAVLRGDGLLWIVIGDVYVSGELLGIPERLHRALERSGYGIVHNSPWVKRSTRPDPAENRLAKSHETLLCISQGADADHYFSRQDASDPTDVFETHNTGGSDVDHDAVYPEGLVADLLEPTVPERVCAACGTPHRPVYEVVDIRNLPTERQQAKRALELAEEHGLSDEHLEALRAVGLSATGQASRTQDGAGKNSDETERLAEEAREVLGSYSREFANPEKEHTGYAVECECDARWKPGICLDPFAGSGTTLQVAKDYYRRFIGIEINGEFVDTARRQVGLDVTDPNELTDSNQQTITEF